MVDKLLYVWIPILIAAIVLLVLMPTTSPHIVWLVTDWMYP